MKDTKELQREVAHFSGHVQGVGFRYTASTIATRFEVTGTVQNLSNGKVLLVVEGQEFEIDRFIDAIESKMAQYITRTDRTEAPYTGEFADFSTRN